jgi:GNAT superfamily N-acetyltransferase
MSNPFKMACPRLDAMKEFSVALMPPSAAEDAMVISALTSLVNEVYAEAEDGLWVDGTNRTSAADIAEFAKAGELATAVLDERLLGCIRIQRLNDEIGEFGMLAADPSYRGIGIGRELVGFAEQRARDWGCSIMQLEVLFPRLWRHPSKDFLDQWYRRIGYAVTQTEDFSKYYRDLSSLLATPCDFRIYHKNIAVGG